jgi:outer membrane protein insertion porin family
VGCRVLALGAIVAACGGTTAVHKPGEEWLQSIRFEGNHQLSSSALLTGLALHRTQKEARALDPYLVQVDADRLRGQYMRAGYFDIDVQARVERKGDASTVTYTIQEGKRATTRVIIKGLPDDPGLSLQKVREALPLTDGAPFDYDKYDLAKVRLLGVVQDAGYAHAKLDATVNGDSATHTATIELAYSPGPKCAFGKVMIAGADGDLRQAIEDRVHFTAGDTYSTSAITKTQRDIYSMNRFSTVQVQPDAGDGQVVDVKISVSESTRHQITLGGGFGVDPISYEVRTRLGYEISGWPMPLDTVTFELRPAYAYLRTGGTQPRIRALARLDRLDLFLTHAVGSVEVGYSYLAYEAFTESGPEAQLGYEIQLIPDTKRYHLRLGWMIERYGFTNINPLVDAGLQMRIGIDHPELVGAYKQSLIADFRDHPIEPRLGWYAEFAIAEGGPWAGGSYTYWQAIPELRGYLPLGSTVFAARARYGAIFGGVPPTERFFAGGGTSNRGFGERRLSPTVSGDTMNGFLTVPYGGAGMIDTSVEARVPLTTVKTMPVHGVVFLDAGDVEETPQGINPNRLIYAVGLGLRVLTIVGPARADVGYRLNRTGPTDPDPGSVWAFHISLGEAF